MKYRQRIKEPKLLKHLAEAPSLEHRLAENEELLTQALEALANEREARKLAEEALWHSEAFFRSLSENASDIITVVDGQGMVRYESPSITRVLGYQPEELLGKNAFDFVHPDDQAEVLLRFQELVERPESTNSAEYRFQHRDGSWRVLESIGRNLLADPIVVGVVINSRDFTSRRQIEIEKAELFSQVRQQHDQLQTQAHELRRLSLRVIKAQEEERKRVSRELHDDAGQSLTVLKVSLELILASLLENHVPPQLCKRLSEAINMCEVTMAHIRMLAHNLRPAALDDLGLNLTLEGFCQDFADHTQLAIVYTGQDTPPMIDAAEICLYRCLQEALTNVARHAQATQVKVCLAYDSQDVSLMVEDNGEGFDPLMEMTPKSHQRGTGLFGLRERLASFGGQLSIQSQTGKGTRLAVKVSRKDAGISSDLV